MYANLIIGLAFTVCTRRWMYRIASFDFYYGQIWKAEEASGPSIKFSCRTFHEFFSHESNKTTYYKFLRDEPERDAADDSDLPSWSYIIDIIEFNFEAPAVCYLLPYTFTCLRAVTRYCTMQDHIMGDFRLGFINFNIDTNWLLTPYRVSKAFGLLAALCGPRQKGTILSRCILNKIML